MTAENMALIRERIIGVGQQARNALEDLRGRVDQIWSSVEGQRLTPEARSSDVAVALAEGRTRVMSLIEDEAQGILDEAIAVNDRVQGRLTSASDDDLAASQRRLSVALTAAASNPQLLINLYRERHLDNADRAVIEGAAGALADALGNTDQFAFRDGWRAVQQEVALQRGPKEVEAVSERCVLEECQDYLANLAKLLGADLSLMNPSRSRADQTSIGISRQMFEAEVNTFELRHRQGWSDTESFTQETGRIASEV